jgi:pimeloyl-ACP methyl ester carboxylesterase
VTSGSAELPNGVRLPYVRQGDPDGTPVILLHGLMDSWRAFDLVLAELPEHVHAIAPTQRGHGEASRPESGYAVRDFATDLRLFLDALAIERAFLVAHSSHTFVVERFGIDHPERTAGLVLVGAPWTLRDRPGVESLLETVSRLADPVDPVFVRDFAQATIHRAVPTAFFETMVRENLKVPARIWREAFTQLLADDLSSELHRIATPTLLIWGDLDAIASREDQRSLLTAIPRSTLLVYQGTGHTPQWEEPARFAADVAAFASADGAL